MVDYIYCYFILKKNIKTGVCQLLLCLKCTHKFLLSRSYLCDQSVKLEAVQLSQSQIIKLFDLTLKNSGTVSPDMYWELGLSQHTGD